MRLNQYIATATGVSRRQADSFIKLGRVEINGQVATLGQPFTESDIVTVDGKRIEPLAAVTTIVLHKPVGYVCSRNGQGSRTVYDLLPSALRTLKPVGRLDKDSSGLLLMTNDGVLAHELAHPRYLKSKIYEICLDKPLSANHLEHITSSGVKLNDGPSRLGLQSLGSDKRVWKVTMHEGRNRQIRRTFAALGYQVTTLHRRQFGNYTLTDLPSGHYRALA